MSFKKNDILVCVYNATKNEGKEAYGGYGWREGLMIKNNMKGGNIVWADDVDGGIYFSHLRLATEQEILLYNMGVRNIAGIVKEPIYDVY